jgi:hypothetical protein
VSRATPRAIPFSQLSTKIKQEGQTTFTIIADLHMQVETLQSDLQALKRENKALKASLKECKDQRAVIEAVSKVEMKLTGEG